MPNNPLTEQELYDYGVLRTLTPPVEVVGLRSASYFPAGYFMSTPYDVNGPVAWRKFHAGFISEGVIDPDRLGTGATGAGNLYLADDGTWKAVGGGGGVGTLDQVTDLGNTTTNTIDVGGVKSDYFLLDTLATPVLQPGMFAWNDIDGTADLRLKGGNVTLQVGQETVARVVNKTGANLLESDYKVVRVRIASEGGAQGQRLAVVLAQGDNDPDSVTTLGIVTENINNNQEGFITVFGNVNEINTTGSLQGETWVDGDVLFLSPTTPGGLTKVKPQAPNHTVVMGYVVYAHANHGKIFVKVDNGYELDELHNVLITSPTTGQLLRYNTNKWENWTPNFLTTVPTLAQVTTAGNTTTNAITVGGLTVATNLIYTDTVNGRVGIGSTSPLVKLYVEGTNVTYIGVKSTTNSGASSYIAYNDLGNSYEFGMWGSTRAAYGVINSGNAYLYGSVDLAVVSLGNLKFSASNIATERMRIVSASGNVLINTTTDAGYKLDVNGTARVSGNLTVDTDTLYVDAANDRVGIGTTTFPTITGTLKLFVDGSGSGSNGRTFFAVRNTSSSSAANFSLINSAGKLLNAQISGPSYTTGEQAGFFTQGAIPLYFMTDGGVLSGGTSRILFYAGGYGVSPTMTITPGNTGNVLIGTTTDTGHKLRVQGTVSAVLTNATHTSQVYYNTTTGELTYGALPTPATPTLDAVTTAGNSTTNSITVGLSSIDTLTVGRGPGAVASNTILGFQALNNNIAGSDNVAVGYYALFSNTTGRGVAIGRDTLYSNTTGRHNIGIGESALYSNTTGWDNMGIGRQTLLSAVNGFNNVAVGNYALSGLINGNYNVAIGTQSLQNTTGSDNIAIGELAGQNNLSGSNNIFIGKGTNGVNTSESNRTWIGNSSTTSTWLAGNVLVGTTTDAGYKLQVNGTFNARNPTIFSESTADNVLATTWRYSDIDSYRLILKQTVTSGVVRWNFSQVNNGTAYNDILVFDRGLVGIGTTNPNLGKLHVEGTVYSTRFELQQGSDLASGVAGLRVLDPFGGMYQYNNSGGYTGHFTSYHIRNTSAATMFYATSSAFGIGTQTPAYRLHVSGGNVMINNGGGGNIYGFDEYHYIKLRDGGDWITLGDYGGIRFYTGNNSTTLTEKVQIAPNGNVGIGTTSPSYRLHLVGGSGYITGGLGANNSSPYSSANRLIFDNDYNDSSRGPNKITLFDSSWLAGFGVQNGAVTYYSGDNHRWYQATTATNAVHLMTLSGTGSLGIGTINPLEKLHISGANRMLIGDVVSPAADAHTRLIIHTTTNQANIVLDPRPTAGDPYYRIKIGVNVDSNGSFFIEQDGGKQFEFFGGGGSTKLTSTVTMGHKTPSFPAVEAYGLHMHSPYNWSSLVRFTHDSYGMTSTDGAMVGILRSDGFVTWMYEDAPMMFGTNNIERMRITNTGDVGIGTITPTSRLHVEGVVSAQAFKAAGQLGLTIDIPTGAGQTLHFEGGILTNVS